MVNTEVNCKDLAFVNPESPTNQLTWMSSGSRGVREGEKSYHCPVLSTMPNFISIHHVLQSPFFLTTATFKKG